VKLDNFAPDPRSQMASGPSSPRLAALVAALSGRIGELEKGTLDLEGLEKAAQEARELHEQLVVLRHKAREEKVKSARAPAAPPPPVSEPPPIRLDVSSPLGDPRQITLIEAIEHEKQVKKEKRAAARSERAAAPPSPSPAPRPVKDLMRSIPISEKFWFIAELFGKDASAYERTIKSIDAAQGLEAAQAIVRTDVLEKLPKPPAEDVMAAFLERIQRRFP